MCSVFITLPDSLDSWLSLNLELPVLLDVLDNKPQVILLGLPCPGLGLQACVATPGF